MSARERIWFGTKFGLRCALVYAAVASVVVLAGHGRALAAYHTTLLKIIAAYLLGGTAIGALGGLLLPLSDSLLGTALLGALCGIPIFYGFGLATDPPAMWLGSSLRTACIAGVTIGPVAALMLRRAIRQS